MWKIPILRHGQPYHSVDTVELTHHATGQPIASMSMANSGMVSRDIGRLRDDALESLTIAQLIRMSRAAASHFLSSELPVGDPDGPRQSFEDYVRALSATTGMPVTYCRNNAGKIHKVLDEVETVIAGLTRGLFEGDLPRHWQSLLDYDVKLVEIDWSRVRTG